MEKKYVFECANCGLNLNPESDGHMHEGCECGYFRISNETRPFQGDDLAEWVRVEYRGPGETHILGVAIGLAGSREDAIEMAKNAILTKIKREPIICKMHTLQKESDELNELLKHLKERQ